MSALEKIWHGSYVHPKINARDARFKIRENIRQTNSEWKVAELSANGMRKGLHKGFKDVVNELNSLLPNLVESISEVSHFIIEPRNFTEVTRSSAYVKKFWLKENLK